MNIQAPSLYAPTWALGAQAIDANGDAHLANGVHLRLWPGATMGLPIFPFRVYRINLGAPEQPGHFRNDGVRFVDANHQLLQPPFNVTASNPVTAFLPPPAFGICCWIELLATAGAGGLRMEAQVSGDRGPTTLATATTARYQLAASRIDRVVIRGQGVVSGVRWLDGVTLLRKASAAGLWRVLSLPLGASARYTPTATALAEAQARVTRGAPKRPPMYRAASAASPAQAPLYPNPQTTEKARVDAASPRASNWLAGLVAAGAPLPGFRRVQSNTADKKPVQMSMSLLNAFWMSTLDPGLSRWAGFGDVDEAPPGSAGHVVAYVVRSIWQSGYGLPADAAQVGALLAMLAGSRIDTLEALNQFKELQLPHPQLAQPPFFDLYTVACATRGKPGDAPQPPVIESFEYKPFLPATPPAARREVVLRARGFAPGPGAALVRVAGSVSTALNPVIAGQPVTLVVSSPQDGGPPGRGRLSDRQAPAEAVVYKLAQADWFGRWSSWSEAPADAATRPRPPQPVLQVSYQPPEAAKWGSSDSLHGLFTVVVPVPTNDALAPGSWPLSHLQVQVGTESATAPVSAVNAQGNLQLTLDGPELPLCGSATVTVTATWVDTDGKSSKPSQPVVRKIHDPRPPEPVELDYALGYASRPDATGKARIDLRWPATGAQQRFRVYYASETSLLSRLAPPLAAEVSATALPERAQWFKDNKNAFSREWFELLTSDPLERGNASEMRLVHEVSGKLATLGFYRVASVSAANVESGFHTAPLVAYAVPNTAPPALPLLDVQLNPASGVASLRLRVPKGVVPAAHVRLRRTTGSPADATQMRVVQEGPWVEDESQGGVSMQQMTLTDAALKPWRHYFWRAEVRGADLPGSALKGAWSRASAAVEAVVLPSTPPQPVSQLQLQVMKQAVVIGFQHDPASLQGGSVGRFKLELTKQVPGGRDTLVATLWADTPTAEGGFTAQGQASFTDKEPAPTGTVYRVLVTDPLGRVSAANPTVAVPPVAAP